jgi:hypothetical protein
MPRFIAVHPVAFTEEQLKPLIKEQLPEGTIWHATFCAVRDNKSFCHWEAPTAETLVQVFHKYEIPYEAIHEVRHFDPVTGAMEPAPTEVKVLQPV